VVNIVNTIMASCASNPPFNDVAIDNSENVHSKSAYICVLYYNFAYNIIILNYNFVQNR